MNKFVHVCRKLWHNEWHFLWEIEQKTWLWVASFLAFGHVHLRSLFDVLHDCIQLLLRILENSEQQRWAGSSPSLVCCICISSSPKHRIVSWAFVPFFFKCRILNKLQTLGEFLLFAFRLFAPLNFFPMFLSTIFKWPIYEQCNGLMNGNIFVKKWYKNFCKKSIILKNGIKIFVKNPLY